MHQRINIENNWSTAGGLKRIFPTVLRSHQILLRSDCETGRTDFSDSTWNTLFRYSQNGSSLFTTRLSIYIIGWPVAHRMHASNRTDLRQSRSTIVSVSRPASDTSPGETLLATCNPVFTYFQTPVSTPDRGPTVCTPVFVSSSAKFLARVLNRVSVGNYYERKRKSFGDAKCYVSTMNTFYSNLERGMLRIAIFRNVSPFFFFFFSF